jgi:hypothetical protein
MVIQKLKIKPTEALYGTKKLIIRNGKKLEVIIPPGVKTGSLVKLAGALQITDGYYGDLFIQINVTSIRNIAYVISAIAAIFIIVASIVVIRSINNDSGNGSMTEFHDKQPENFYSYGKPVSLVNNPNAIDPTWQELKDFLLSDKTDEQPYIEYSYECASYAEEVHNHAEARGIRAAFVSIWFLNDFEGHALNAFRTTDKGLVYIDCSTGIGVDLVAYIEKDKEYGIILLEMAESFDYNYFISFDDDLKLELLGIVEEIYIYW